MKNIIKILLFFSFTGWSLSAEGQIFESSKSGSAIAIRGTSSLHDWEMNLEAFNSVFQLKSNGSVIKGIENVSFSCRATDIKSDYSLMDKKTRDALKADEFPEIKFTGMSGPGIIINGKEFTGDLKGKLSVAGENRDILIPFKGYFTGNNTINIVASADLQMSSFNITPPTAMMGALKTGDQVTVSFSLQFLNTENKMISSAELR